MKKIALGLALSAAVAAQIPHPAGAAPILGGQVDAQLIQGNQRPPIPFKPFPLADLKTGQPLAPDTILRFKSGKTMKAGDFIAQINELERKFNALGFTLRQPGVFKIGALKIDPQQLQGQIAMLPPASVAKVALIRRGVDGDPPVIPGGGGGGGTTQPPPPPPSPPGSISKSWSYLFGSRGTVGAELSGELNLNGTTQGMNANGTARASGAILGNEWDLARVTGSLNAPKSGVPGSAKLNLYVVGIGDMALLNQPLTQASFSASNNVSRSLDVHTDIPIPVWPFTVNARLGARGSAGVQYGLNLSPTAINVALKPQVQVDAYGQGGISVGVAEGGVGCDLTLLHNTLSFGAQGTLSSNAIVGSTLKAHVFANDSLSALSGRLYAYAKVDLLFWDDEWQFDIWNFSGINRNFTLFDESKTLQLSPGLKIDPTRIVGGVKAVAAG